MNPLSLITGALGGVWGYVAAAVISAGLAGFLGYDITHKIDLGTVNAIKLADQKAQSKAIQEAAAIIQSQDKANLDAAVSEAKSQQQIVTHTVTVTKEITNHVTDNVPCIPYGLIRVLNDAATGSDQADAPAPAGQPDDACSGVSWRSFASDLTDDYGTGRQNAEQLNSLEADIRQLVQAANSQ